MENHKKLCKNRNNGRKGNNIVSIEKVEKPKMPKPVKCKYCPETFTTSGDLITHSIQEDHPTYIQYPREMFPIQDDDE